MLPILKCCPPPSEKKEIPSLYLLGEVDRKEPNRCSESLALVRLLHPGASRQNSTETQSKKLLTHTHTVPPDPQILVDHRSERTSINREDSSQTGSQK